MHSILITRPEPQASELATQVRMLDIRATVFPTIEIHSTQDVSWQTRLLREAKPEDLFIVISQNAATAINKLKIIKSIHCIAIGKGTAQVLQQNGFTNIHYSADVANSESALALPILQNITGQTCWLLRGNGGRELLPDTLRQRGAIVNTLTCYERHLPIQSIQPVIDQWKQSSFDCVICTSLEGLQNLCQLLGEERVLLQQTPITVVSENMIRCAQAHGIVNTHWLQSASNTDILTWLAEHL